MGDTIVEESNLSQTIFILRKTLGENTKEPRFILTVPNRGYQFIAPVGEIFADNEILEEFFFSNKHSSAIPSLRSSILRPKTKDQKSKIKLSWLAIPFVLLLAFGIY